MSRYLRVLAAGTQGWQLPSAAIYALLQRGGAAPIGRPLPALGERLLVFRLPAGDRSWGTSAPATTGDGPFSSPFTSSKRPLGRYTKTLFIDEHPLGGHYS